MKIRLKAETTMLTAFAAAVLVAATLAALTWKLSQDAVEAAVWVSHTHKVLDGLTNVERDTLLIELSTQNYRISGDLARLAERDAAISARETSLRRVKELTADNARQQEHWTQLRATVDERIAIARSIVLLRETQGPEAANAYQASAPLRETRERVFRLFREMEKEERRLLTERSAEQLRVRQVAVAIGSAAALLLAALLTATYFLIRWQMRATGVAMEQARAADRIKSAFLATMSHELRTPLNSIIGFTGIILQGLTGPLNPEQTKQLGMVQDSARHLLALINDVLDISKIEAGELTVGCEPFDLRASITKVAGIVKPLAAKKGLALRVELAPELGEAVSDSRRVEQVLLNLLNNAIKFTERGEVALTAEVTSADVRMRVTDTGIGIKPEDLEFLFQPFRQLDTGLARNHEGTGLGLAICRRLADLMGGEIRAESEWGKGSTFTFTLPLKLAEQP